MILTTAEDETQSPSNVHVRTSVAFPFARDSENEVDDHYPDALQRLCFVVIKRVPLEVLDGTRPFEFAEIHRHLQTLLRLYEMRG
jgi:hypothetical protein